MTTTPAKFIAENVPAYSVEPWADKPWRDEDLGMSAKITIGKFDSEDAAREALIMEMAKWADYYGEKAKYSKYYEKDHLVYLAAAEMFAQGSTAVKIHQRYHRVRPANEHGF